MRIIPKTAKVKIEFFKNISHRYVDRLGRIGS